jgi:hypothetical protein
LSDRTFACEARRVALLEMADGFERRAKELEAASMLRSQAPTDFKQL